MDHPHRHSTMNPRQLLFQTKPVVIAMAQVPLDKSSEVLETRSVRCKRKDQYVQRNNNRKVSV